MLYVFIKVGAGFLPLMFNRDCLIDDIDHVVNIYGSVDDTPTTTTNRASKAVSSATATAVAQKNTTTDSSSSTTAVVSHLSESINEGVIRVKTRAISALTSKDKRIQKFFYSMPIPFGAFPTTIMSRYDIYIVYIIYYVYIYMF